MILKADPQTAIILNFLYQFGDVCVTLLCFNITCYQNITNPGSGGGDEERSLAD
jgi:hypothetical protein